jgi:hypothetical protein
MSMHKYEFWVMALGMNHGLGRLARSTQFSYRQLAWATDWHIREDTIRAALIELDQFVLRPPLARHWGDGTRSSSDGMRVRVAVNAANADRNAAATGSLCSRRGSRSDRRPSADARNHSVTREPVNSSPRPGNFQSRWRRR